MSKDIKKSKKGFTIIEVVLVLAIAGLIFLMVFVALPTLQRSQRDTQRRSDMSRLAAALTQYQANNNNTLPANDDDGTGAGKTLKSTYLGGDDFKDPNGSAYVIKISSLSKDGTATHSSETSDGNIMLVKSASCDGESAAFTSGSNSYAILYKLEGAGTSCTDNQ